MGRPYNFEEAPDLPGSDRLSKTVFGGMRRLTDALWDFVVEGADNVPLDGPAIITPNHLSFCDSIFVPAALPRRVWAIGKGEYMDSWKTKHLFPAMGMIPVDRSGGDAAQAALDTAAKVLESGRLFMIYPEGTRSRSEHLHKGRTGAARLSIRCDAPIVPVGHEGTIAVQPPDSVVLKPRLPVTVRIGRPMWAHEHGDPDDPRTLRAFTDAVMFEIAQLSQQQYVDTYASKDDQPGKPAPAPTVTKPASTDHHLEHVTPKRPSVIGSGEGNVPTPPARPAKPVLVASGHGTNGADAVPELVTVPPGRQTSSAV